MAIAQTILIQDAAEELVFDGAKPDKLCGKMLDFQHAVAFLPPLQSLVDKPSTIIFVVVMECTMVMRLSTILEAENSDGFLSEEKGLLAGSGVNFHGSGHFCLGPKEERG